MQVGTSSIRQNVAPIPDLVDLMTELRGLIESGSYEVLVQKLNEHPNFDIEEKGCFNQSLLNYAAEIGDEDIINYLLLEKKADPFSVDDAGKTALHQAVHYDYYEVADVLILWAEDNARLDLLTAEMMDGSNILHLILGFKNTEESLEFIKKVVTKFSFILEKKDKNGETALDVGIRYQKSPESSKPCDHGRDREIFK